MAMRRIKPALTALALSLGLIGASTAAAEAQTLLLRDPAISADKIAFVYAGDIYVANRDGTSPRRLTSHAADEGGPVFSPDGSKIAYTARYNNNTDVYTISVNGGQPTRLTFHPGADTAIDWSPDGSEVAFVSRRETNAGRSQQLYHVSVDGGLPEQQMKARVFRGRYNSNARQFASIAYGPAYNGLYGGSSGWKGYRGGTTPSIQLFDMRRDRVTTIPGERVNDIEPMWVGDQVYFLSDRANDEILNLYRFNPDDGTVTKVTNETVWDIRAADVDGDTIIYEAGGQLKTFSTQSGQTTTLSVSLNPDLPQLQTRWKSVAGQMTSAHLSKSGKRVAVTARGEVFSVPVKDGAVRNLSDSSGVREYSAQWSPDGTQIAYIVEKDRGQVLRLEDQSGIEDVREIALGDDFYSLATWTGDGKHIVYENNHLETFILNVEAGTSVRIADEARRQWGQGLTTVAASPDGKWVALALEQANFNRDLFLYNIEGAALTKVTDGLADVGAPAFSRDGKLLFFTGSTNSGQTQVGLDMSTQERPYRAGIYVAVLEADGKSPLLPKSGDEEAKKDDEDKESGDKDEKKDSGVVVALEGLADRITALPLPEASYDDLAVGKDGALYFIQYVQPGVENSPPGTPFQADAELIRFDMKEKKAKTLTKGVLGLQISQDGSHMMAIKPGQTILVGKTGAKFDPKPLKMSGVRMEIDPGAEWAQIFDDVWRMQKDYFYDPALHGADWDAVYAQYKPLLEHVGRREDLNTLMVEMIAELQAGHNRLGGGDVHREQGAGSSLLGADFSVENGRHRIKKIYTGESWNPFLKAPLAEPGLDVSEGDYVIAINGKTLGENDNIFEFLEGTGGTQIRLELSSRTNGSDSRIVTVEPTGNEGLLRLWSWVEGNRKAVAAASDGKIGYVYLPNTAGAGYTLFNRMFFAQTDKDAIIIDERANGGGQAANYITDVLSRTYLSGWKDRDGMIFNTPGGAMFGPKLMMIDQDAGSGGDFLPYSFRQMNIGTLLGTRTWGGLIGISANPGLVDGGFLTVPYFRYFDPNGNWTIENEGVAPDIEVQLDPIAANKGRDTQLEAAIAEVLRQIETNPSPVPAVAPAYPTELGE